MNMTPNLIYCLITSCQAVGIRVKHTVSLFVKFKIMKEEKSNDYQ